MLQGFVPFWKIKNLKKKKKKFQEFEFLKIVLTKIGNLEKNNEWIENFQKFYKKIDNLKKLEKI